MLKKILNTAFYSVAGLYVLLMLDLFFRVSLLSSGSLTARSYNLVPFGTIGAYLGGTLAVSPSVAMNNVLGNVVVFVPFGLYLQTLLKNKALGKSLFIVAAASAAIEALQFILRRGAADIDDFILNLCGGLLGILGYRLLRKILGGPAKARTAVAILSLAAGAPILLLYFRALLFRYL